MNILRLQALQKLGGKHAVLITHLPNIFYLTGFKGSNAVLLITSQQAILFTDPRYTLQAAEEVTPEVTLTISAQMWPDIIKSILQLKPTALLVEADHLSLSKWQNLEKNCSSLSLQATQGLVEGLRLIKDVSELAAISHAAQIVDKCLAEIFKGIRPGQKERQLAQRIERIMQRLGADEPSFPTIVASGVQGALPHAHPGNKKIARGELITLDLGAKVSAYCSDCTRTIMIGSPTKEQEKVYQTVWEAQAAAVKMLQPGKAFSEAEQAARAVIKQAGYGDYFTHSLGHGVGLEIHEAPSLSLKSSGNLQPGMVVTCEPGIYLPGWGGVRLEDLYVITPKGAERLSQAANPPSVPRLKVIG